VIPEKSESTVEIRWHGRGGQGAVTSAELVAHAAISEGKFGQAFPSFGPERRGAPVLAFNRISDKQVRIRSAVENPDIVIVLDPRLLDYVDVNAGLKEDSIVLLNTKKSINDIKSKYKITNRIGIVNATTIALETIKINIVNTTILGLLVRATGVIKLESLEIPLKNRFGAAAERNIAACKRAYQESVIEEK